jgi:tRNA (cytidine/uridine-2'-O-)-methyltransferase
MPNTLIRLILFQPDIPQNTGAVLRLGACFNVPVEIIEPCGFVWDDKRLKRAEMDYTSGVELTRHRSWDEFAKQSDTRTGRLVLFTTKAAAAYHEFGFETGDRLLFGQESAGVPDTVHEAAHQRVRIPIAPDQRSLNLAQAAAIGLTEALRQTGGLPVV